LGIRSRRGALSQRGLGDRSGYYRQIHRHLSQPGRQHEQGERDPLKHPRGEVAWGKQVADGPHTWQGSTPCAPPHTHLNDGDPVCLAQLAVQVPVVLQLLLVLPARVPAASQKSGAHLFRMREKNGRANWPRIISPLQRWNLRWECPRQPCQVLLVVWVHIHASNGTLCEAA
jgi:hypothetical protein